MGKTINASIAEQNLIIEPSVISVAESVNAYSLKITYDEDWSDVDAKIVTFSGANGQSFAIQDNGEENGVTIPWEVLQCPGKVSVGVVGYVGSEMKLTTTGLYNRNTFVVLPEAFGLKSAMTPTPDIYQKLLQTIDKFDQGLAETNANIGDLNNLETEAKNNLVAAINEALNGGGGEGTVKSVNQKEPDAEGNVELSAGDVGAATAESVEELAATVVTKQDTLTQTQLAAVNSGIDSTKVAQIATNVVEIDQVKEKIPAQASASNQLADKQFVNSSIQTQTAHFRGNWENWNAVPTDATEYPVDDDGNHEPTTNDYMVVQDASGFPVGSGEPALAGTWRFKYSGTWTTNGKNGWLPEYQVNETPLTAAQLAALNSGITDTAVAKLNGIEAGAEVNTIDSISVNGTAVAPDANKNVALTIPEGVKVLSSADYNYPANNPTSVGAWLLETGIYKAPSGVSAKISTSLTPRADSIFFVQKQQGGMILAFFTDNSSNVSGTLFAWVNATGSHTNLAGVPYVDSLTSVSPYQALSAKQGKVLNDLIDSIAIRGTGAPTTSTVGTVGQLYEDGTNGDLYQLKSIDTSVTPNIYNWEEVGGSSVNVVQTTGTSTTDVMSQVAASRLIYPSGQEITKRQIAIGDDAEVASSMPSGIAIGRGAKNFAGYNGIAIGRSATIPAGVGVLYGAIALGDFSSPSHPGEMNIGSTNTTYGYNFSNYRLLTGVYDPQSAHDAATKGYVDSHSATTLTNTEFNSILENA